jgi:RecA/RadA recombinase
MKKESTKKQESSSDEKDTKIVPSRDQLDTFLKINKESHYNYEEEINYKVSSGSLWLDYHLGGGLGTGLHRFLGGSEHGKTSSSLAFMYNFLLTDAEKFKRKGVLFKSEGRLSKEIQERVGVKFVWTKEEWVYGTCFVFETNIYETAVALMRELVHKNDEKNQYFFLLDSVDALIKKDDNVKTEEESSKVAGGAVIASDFMKRVALALQKRGHIAIFISQVRADIKLDPYSKAPIRQTTATGGNALMHYANWILEFEPRFKSDLILESPDAPIDLIKNKPLGHFVKLTVKKSPNETTNLLIKYPIKYGQKNGKSNWIEREIFDFLITWELLEKKGAWLNFDEEFREVAKESGVNIPESVHGVAKFDDLVNSNDSVKNFLISYIKKSMAPVNAV